MDTTKWNVRNNTYASNEESIVTSRPENVRVSESILTIAGQKETYKIPNGTTTRNFTSGYLDTMRGKASFQYGRFEIRAKLPTQRGVSKGFWPAFWLRPQDGGNGEIDVFESIGNEHNKIHATIHHDYISGTQHIKAEPKTHVVPFNTADAFHVYALEWTATEMVWYVDGVEYYRRDPNTTPWYAEVFRKPYNLRLNLQVGGNWPGTPDETTTFPGLFQVDWVRVYAPE